MENYKYDKIPYIIVNIIAQFSIDWVWIDWLPKEKNTYLTKKRKFLFQYYTMYASTCIGAAEKIFEN